MKLVIRWTIGNVSERGYEALRLSLHAARRLFGREARYVVCVNTIPLERARALAGAVPGDVEWRDATRELPDWIRREVLADNLADGAGWKLAPLQIDPQARELALDNDVILWDLPEGLRAWLNDPDPRACCVAEDLGAFYGQFAPLCGPEPRNAGIRGLPAGVDLEREIRAVLEEIPVRVASETDEQGLQVAIVSRHPCHVVRTREVTICSPWPIHQSHLGVCGAHFVGQNARDFPEEWGGEAALRRHVAHWRRYLRVLHKKAGLAYAEASAPELSMAAAG